VSGTFNYLVNTNLPAGFQSSLGYDANNAYLNLALSFGLPGDLNNNQQNVGNALIDFFDRNGGISGEFGALTPANLTQASGELATATQQATVDAMTQLGSRPTGSIRCGGLTALRRAGAFGRRAMTATFQTLPGASFTVNGAALDPDAALTTVSLEMKWQNGWSVAAAFDGEFSNATRGYTGMGIVRYQW